MRSTKIHPPSLSSNKRRIVGTDFSSRFRFKGGNQFFRSVMYSRIPLHGFYYTSSSQAFSKNGFLILKRMDERNSF